MLSRNIPSLIPLNLLSEVTIYVSFVCSALAKLLSSPWGFEGLALNLVYNQFLPLLASSSHPGLHTAIVMSHVFDLGAESDPFKCSYRGTNPEKWCKWSFKTIPLFSLIPLCCSSMRHRSCLVCFQAIPQHIFMLLKSLTCWVYEP